MGLTIYTKGNINLATYGQDHADVGAKRGSLFGGLNDPFWGVCDLLHTQKDELSQSKHMGMTIYTKGNINLVSYGQDHSDVASITSIQPPKVLGNG